MVLRISLALFLLPHLVSPAYSGLNFWTGADSSAVRFIRIHPSRPSVLYLGTKAGVFATEDEGRTFISLNNGLDGPADSLELNPEDPRILYAVIGSQTFRSTNGGADWYVARTGGGRLITHPTDGRVVFLVTPSGQLSKSTDSGGTWTDLITDLAQPISHLAISRSNPAVLYASTPVGKLWRSDDEGAHWQGLTGLNTNTSVNLVAVDPSNTMTVYQAPKNKGLFKSTDGGNSWTAAIPPATYGGTDIVDFCFSPADSSRAFAVDSHGALYRSPEAGGAFTGLFIRGQLSTIVTSPQRPGLMYAVGQISRPGRSLLFKSTDWGGSWYPIVPALFAAKSLVLDPNNADRMYVLHSKGLARSTDGGKSWKHLGEGLDYYLTDLAVDYADGRLLYCLGGAGIYRSQDAGETWQLVMRDVGWNWLTVQVDPHHPGYVYAFRYGGAGLRSTDSGLTWSPAVFSLPSTVVGPFVAANERIVFDPVTPETVYAFSPGISKSTNGGRSWVSLGGGDSGMPAGVSALVVSPHDSKVYARRQYDSVLRRKPCYVSTDGGVHWTILPADFRWPLFCAQDTDRLFGADVDFKDPLDPLLSEYYVWRSDNRGQDWYPIRYDLRHVSIIELALDPIHSDTLYALVKSEGLYKSTDSSVTWRVSSEGLPRGLTTVKVDQFDRSVLLAAGTEGIFKSSNAGLHWDKVYDQSVSKIVIDPSTAGSYYAVGKVGQLFKSEDTGSTWQELSTRGWVKAAAVSYSSPEVLFAGGGGTLSKSSDRGVTWTDLHWEENFLPVEAIDIDPQDPGVVQVTGCYPQMMEGPRFACLLYDTRDGGLTWTTSQYGLGPLYRDPADPFLLYSRPERKVSFDGGATWSEVPNPPFAVVPAFSPADHARAYVADVGIFSITMPQLAELQAEVTYVPQIGTGRTSEGELQTEFLLTNSGVTTRVEIDFFGSDRQPFPVTLGDMSMRSSFSIAVGTRETVSLKTGNTGSVGLGFARIRATADVRTAAVYSYSEGGRRLFEAGISPAKPLQDCTVFVKRAVGRADTGIAIANVSEQPAQITFRLYDENFALLASRQISEINGPFQPGSRASLFVTEIFPELAASNLELGVLTLESDQPVAVASLLLQSGGQQADDRNFRLTALPILSGRADGANPWYPVARKLYLPQVAGGTAGRLEMRSSLLLTNLGLGTARAQVRFLDSAGKPLSVPLLGDTELRSEVDISMDPGKSAQITVGGENPLNAGYAVLTLSGAAGAAAFYECWQAGELQFSVATPVESQHSRYGVFASITNSQDTAIALVNTASKPAEGLLTLYDSDGEKLGSKSFSSVAPFGPGERVARYLSELFPGVQTASGRLIIESDQPLAGLTLRQHDDPAVPYPFDLFLLTCLPMGRLP